MTENGHLIKIFEIQFSKTDKNVGNLMRLKKLPKNIKNLIETVENSFKWSVIFRIFIIIILKVF